MIGYHTMAMIPAADSVGILRVIHNEYSTALLNKKYYGRRLTQVKKYNLTLEVLIALGATGATGAGIAGLTIWKDGFGVTVWGILSSISIILSTLKPLLPWSTQIERYSKLWGEYASMHGAIQIIEDDLGAKNTLTTEQVEAFQKLRDRVPELQRLDDVNPNRDVIRAIQQEVNAEIPVNRLWMPPAPSTQPAKSQREPLSFGNS